MKVSYYAVFDYSGYHWKEKEYGIEIYFPDVPAAISCARNEVEGIKFAKEVLQLVFYGEENLVYPEKTPIEKIPLGKNEIAYLIEYDTDDIDHNQFASYRKKKKAEKRREEIKNKKEQKSRKEKKLEKRRIKEEKKKNKHSI